MAVPARVFSVSGEVLAFRATGGDGKVHTETVSMSLEPLRKRFGRFERATVFEFNASGKRISQSSVNVSTSAAVEVQATTGNYYLTYAELGERYSNSYRVACNLSGLNSRGQDVPEICKEIFCVDRPFEVADLGKRFPVLQELGAFEGLTRGEVGGLSDLPAHAGTVRPLSPMPIGGGRGGSDGGVCGTCENIGRGTFEPVGECSVELPISGDVLPGPVVYQRIDYTDNDSRGPTQIFKLGDDSSQPINLSNNQHVEHDPDVSPDGQQIAFARSDEGLFIMDINGGNVTAVPNTEWGSKPKWILQPNQPYLVYIRANGNINYVRPDGTDNHEVTDPGNRFSDVHVDRYDGKNIIFERTDSRRRFDQAIFGLDVFGNAFIDSDLFIKYLWDADRAPVRLTNTPDIIEAYPTGANRTEGLVAFSVFSPAHPACEVRVARVEFDDTLTVLNTIRLNVPADWGINGISFSSDDSMLFISTRARTTDNVIEARKYELFAVRVDGTHQPGINNNQQQRITNNQHLDAYPSAIPR